MTTTSGKDQSDFLPRRSIAGGERIPNAAIFLKRTALEFLQIIFGNMAQGHYRWDADDSCTEIQISDVHAVDFGSPSLRPAIIAVRGPVSWQGLGLGGGSLEKRSMTTGDSVYSDLLTGSVAFNCISREGIEAEQLAHVVFNSFKFFKRDLRKYGFFTIKSMNIGGESLIEQAGSEDKTTLVPIYVTAQIQDRWSLSDTAGKKLKEIIFETLCKGG